ncbi:unnamed protein product [Didymodactylos carnosus]|uniref:Nucleoside phosphorylase domain-containing protein n=1 Tax=Didymodactylos carnosus TaxID=1234261 RepID=A0A8S2D0B1_9BILA|nr:unnamed protein product [Didymodactylos carnosus]CAF3633786.1 unnamed protein product [Didymodactylos carnosus]
MMSNHTQISNSEQSNFTSNLNSHVKGLNVDYYYHLGLNSTFDLKSNFGDVKYVLMCGSAVRAYEIIQRVIQSLKIRLPVGQTLAPIGKTERYSMFKVGPVISISHGMGKPSASIMLHEITKLLSAAGVYDPIYIRIGTSGGVGIEGGTVVIANGVVNGLLQPYHPVAVLGKIINRPAKVDLKIAKEIYDLRGDIPAIMGTTMSTDDFYEGQARIDGAICDYDMEDKLEFLKRAYDAGVRNIEMEGNCCAAFCTRLNIHFVMVCVAYLNRLNGDGVSASPQQLTQYESNAITLVLRYIQKKMGLEPTCDSQGEFSIPHALHSKPLDTAIINSGIEQILTEEEKVAK